MSWLRCPVVLRAFVVLLAGQLLVGTGWATVQAAQRWGWGAGAAVLVVGAAASGCCLWALVREGERRNAVLFGLAVSGGLILHAAVPHTGAALLYASVWLLPFRAELRPAAVLAVTGTAGFAVVSLLSGMEGGPLVGNTLGLAYSAAMAFLIRQLALTGERTAEVAEARAREAVLAERTRLAREVHDVLAHSQSAQIVHLEGARLLLGRGQDPAAALDRVERAVRLARTGLEETRRALDALRGQELPLAERLERLAIEFRSVTGDECVVSVAPDLGPMEAEARLAVARTAQEALTNVRKHAPGASASVTLRRSGRWCELEVRDTGGSPGSPGSLESSGFSGSQPPAGSGYGLVGMRERAELIGGSLTAGPCAEGFGVLLRVPAHGGGDDGTAEGGRG
ncbi:sensor histidine kinase [Planobispora siamensis]|uniref:sensor histidine kinase n=1 Tax=Planobispora siamensis TaxID=936338 RepID=UPI001952933E|nr:sensor histidine kinase [Planobispora siamensis]